MKLSQLFAPTLKEDPKEAEVVSHKLLLRGGYLRKLAAGIYDFLPLGVRTLRKIETIIREEMNRAGAQEVLLPAVQPAELWKESGRWTQYGPELLRFKDRKSGDFVIGPTHEEVITDLVRGDVRSYRELPLNLYQVQAKFRDEIRPRAGLMRGREFIMKDAYSFDADEAGALRSYEAMYEAYNRIFTRCGLRFRPVEADTGNIGGNRSHEFQVLAESGEDSIVSCPSCGYTANVEKAEIGAFADAVGATGDPPPLVKVHTPDVRSVEQVAAFFGAPLQRVVKTLLFVVDARPVAVLIRGDLDVNELKLRAALGADAVGLASDSLVAEVTGAPVGFAGPIGLRGAEVVLDRSVRGIVDGIVGGNEGDMHYTGFVAARDAEGAREVDVRLAQGGDPCGRCGATFEFFRGIEVGHVFFLGTKYSDALGATFLDESGAERSMVMGCYGIGVTRVMAAAIEQNHDASGICWPAAIAPFHAAVLPLQPNDAAVMDAATTLWRELNAAGVETVLDDRDQRPGVKFKDADLIGFPWRIVVGARGLAEGKVEFKHRRQAEAELVPVGEAVARVREALRAELAGGAGE